jgi:secreted trypsin-like serine protease
MKLLFIALYTTAALASHRVISTFHDEAIEETNHRSAEQVFSSRIVGGTQAVPGAYPFFGTLTNTVVMPVIIRINCPHTFCRDATSSQLSGMVDNAEPR